MRDRATVEVLEPVGAVLVEPDGSVAVDREAHPGAPAQTLEAPGDRLHLDGALDPGQLTQELGDAGGLQAPLGGELHVLEVAAAAPARAGVGARSRHPVRGRPQDLDGVSAPVRAGLRGDPRHHPLAGQRVPDEDDLAVGGPGHAPAAPGDGADLELELSLALGLQRVGRHAPEA